MNSCFNEQKILSTRKQKHDNSQVAKQNIEFCKREIANNFYIIAIKVAFVFFGERRNAKILSYNYKKNV